MFFKIVSDINQLQTVINNTEPNSKIQIKNGIYLVTSVITIKGSNITIEAETPGGVIFQEGNVSINITGNNNVINGIQFKNTSSNMSRVSGKNFNSRDLISVSGNNNTLSNININNVYAYHFINIYGGTQYNTIINCNIQNKHMDNTGCLASMIQIQGDPVIVGYHKIQHCTFQGMLQGGGGDYGCEPIRLGDSQYSTCNLSTIVEYCVFDNTQLADSETISVKSMYNIIRYNTFSNNQGGYVSYRNGNNNVCYGNFFLSSSGIRVKQASNISIYNNYFYNSNSPIVFIDMTGLYPDLSIYQNGVNIQNNTFYNSYALNFGTRTTTNNTIANNLFYQASNSMSLISGNIVNFQCVGNYYFGNLGIISYGFKSTNPLISLNQYGYYNITSNSPLKGKSNKNATPLLQVPNENTDNQLLLDITGSIRVGTNDVGCNQVNINLNNSLPLNIPLIISMKGCNYLH